MSHNMDYGTIEQEKAPTSRHTGCCHPSHWTYRYTMLLMLCYTFFAIFYCAESPGGLEDIIIEVMEVDAEKYNLLLSVSYWPNVVLCLVGGVAVDRLLGLRLGCILVTLTATLGQFIWALGAFVDQFWVMLVGRFFIGIGGELISVIGAALIICWFDKSQLTFTMSLGVTARRIGASVGLASPQFVYEHLTFFIDPLNRLGATLLVGIVLLLLGIVACLFFIIMDIRAEKVLQREKHKFSKIKCSDLNQFSLTYWLIVLISTMYFPVAFSFVGIGQVFFIQKFGLSLETSGVANSLIFLAGILVTPLLGYLIDVVGYHGYWLMLGIISALAAHLTLLFCFGQTFIPFIAGVLYSISYSIIVPSLWSVPGFLVEANQAATAYGIIQCAFDLVISGLTVLTGFLVDEAGYFVLEIMFSLLLYLGMISTILLWIVDSTAHKPVINVRGHCGQEKAIELVDSYST